MRVLVVAPSWIGDLVMSQCLYKALKSQYPDATLHVLAPKWCLDVLNRMPEVDRTILMPIGHGSFALKGRWALGRSLKLAHYDQAFILPNSWKSALIPLFAGIKKRTGWKGESRYLLLNDLRTGKERFPLLVERYSALAYPKKDMHDRNDLKTIFRPQLTVKPLPTATLLFSKFNIVSTKAPLGLCPGAEFGPAKKWPPEFYAYVAQRYLENNSESEVWIFGSPKDVATGEEVVSHIPEALKQRVRIIAGKTTIEEAIDLLSACKLVICNDSGLMHIAAAVGTRLAAVFGSTSTRYTPPQTDDALIIESEEPCHPCFKRECRFGTFACLKHIKPELVWTKLQEKWPDLCSK